jgi:hypothetical protein
MRLRNDQGFVSLFTTIMISLLLLVITVSLISLETLQLRKSEDAEQTLRAYYAAEAGVEDAVSKVLSKTVSTDQTCTSNASYDIPGAAGWTCQQISFSGTPTGKLPLADEARTIDPGDVSPPYQSVIIEWGDSTDNAPNHYNMASWFQPSSGASSYATKGCTSGATLLPCAVAPIELSIVEYPNGSFSANDAGLKLQNVVVAPGGATGGGAVNYTNMKSQPQFRGNCGPSTRTGLPAGLFAGGTSNYNCYVVLQNLPPNKNYQFRIRSRYLPSAYKFTFKADPNGGGATRVVPDGTATIDVTAKAGQTYRRVISKLPLGSSGASGLNYVMYSDTNICKNFDVLANAVMSPPGCPY